MTPERLRECLLLAHWSQHRFADLIQYSPDTVRQWSRGKLPIPDDVANWLENIAGIMKEHPAPIRK